MLIHIIVVNYPCSNYNIDINYDINIDYDININYDFNINYYYCYHYYYYHYDLSLEFANIHILTLIIIVMYCSIE